jgi:hypothetical protein
MAKNNMSIVYEKFLSFFDSKILKKRAFARKELDRGLARIGIAVLRCPNIRKVAAGGVDRGRAV